MRITTVSQSLGYLKISYEVCGSGTSSTLAYWRKERLFLKVKATKLTEMLLLIDAQSNDDALTYSVNIGNNYIELTNLINDNSREVVVKTRSTTGGIVGTTLQIQVVGDIDYRRIDIPANDSTSTDLYQLPPRMMYTLYGGDVQAEVGALADFTLDGATVAAPTNKQYVNCILGEGGMDVSINDWHTILQELPCGQPYRLVQWRSRLGGQKEHYWLLKDRKLAVADSIELVSTGYDERKSSVETATLYIDDLSEYDVYYYADIIISDDVHIDGRSVKVNTSNITYPNGLERGSIEVEVELHRTQIV